MGLLGSSDDGNEYALTDDADHGQRYEYTSVAWQSGVRKSKQNPDETLNEYARNGWQLVERVTNDGQTQRLIFERPVGDGA
jgi:hypothetical protein